MKIEFTCSFCNSKLYVTDKYQSLRFVVLPDKCPICGSRLSNIDEVVIDLGDGRKIRKVYVYRSNTIDHSMLDSENGVQIVTFKIPSALLSIINKLASRIGVTRSALIRYAILQYISQFKEEMLVEPGESVQR